MDFPSGLNRRYASLAGSLLAGIWLWVAFDRPYVFPEHVPWNIYSNSPQSPSSDVFDFPPLTSPAIKNVCARTQWNASVVFTCDSPIGSFAEIRNSVLHCVRYTIAAGGSLVMPRIVLKEDYGGLLAGNTTGLDHLFDVDHFRNSLDLSCPQLRLYKSVSEIKDKERANGPLPLLPDALLSGKSEGSQGFSVDWRDALNIWLKKYLSEDTKDPVIISLGRTYLHYSIHSDDDNFAQHFGKILKIRSDARSLATTVLLKMSSTYSLPLNPSPSKKGFMGAYLSTAPDPDRLLKEDQNYARFETQSKLYLDYATHSNMSLIYVASNQGIDVPRLFVDAKAQEIDVTAKFDLLKGKDRDYLLEMTTLQREMVDLLVMMNAAHFVGVGYSSFSWNVALRRHGARKIEQLSEQGQQFNDGLSVIYGTTGGHSEFITSMWP
ncbi:uncharacterized protein LY89DRAFT_679587 [Mollisia scopiformis]|uniref:Alternative oxidase n=1 Tax=Mollisia scopiformis TaxID=149040 RepID=A0A194XVV7_MOLSC|nr:uncharacterized protein LY89DRAFT_679587 [Mollisia scopiformis]KUJ24450.1 hypothetical protein LY89DRAFT_679587 [Mollisia scopiformis]